MAGLEGGLSVSHDTLLGEPRVAQRALSRRTAHGVRVQQGRDEPLGRLRHSRPRLAKETAALLSVWVDSLSDIGLTKVNGADIVAMCLVIVLGARNAMVAFVTARLY